MASYLDSPMYQRMMAETLRGSQRGPQYPGEAVANALATALQAYGTRQYGKELEGRDNAKADALAQALGPSDNSAWKTGTGMDGGMPSPVSVSPRVGSGIGERIAATGNRDLINDTGPALVKALMGQQAQANAPVRPYEQAQLDQRAREFDINQANNADERVDRAMFQSNQLGQGRNELRQRAEDNEAQREFTAWQSELTRTDTNSRAAADRDARLEAARIAAGARAAAAGVTGERGNRRDATTLRKEFNSLPDVRQFNEISNQYEVLSDIKARGAKSPTGATAADDMSMIFAYMKMLDPPSVVREGEQANAQNTTGIPGRIINAYNNALKGTRLNDQQRSEFVNAAGGIYESRKKRYDQLIGEYKGYERESGLPEGTIIERIPAGAKPGTAGKTVKWDELP